MTRTIHLVDRELPAHILERRRWIADMEQSHRTDEQASMEMLVYWVMLGITCTFCLAAWVLW